MGWHTNNRLDYLEDELLRKDEEIAELRNKITRLEAELTGRPYNAELEDYKLMHAEEE